MPVPEIAELKPDLIIVNFWMPEGYGSEMCNDLKIDESTKNIPIILLSSVNKSVLIDECKTDHVIYKPFDLDVFFRDCRKTARGIILSK